MKNNVIYLVSFGVKYMPEENKKFIRNKNITTSVYRTQACDSITCGYFCIGCIGFVTKSKSFWDYTSLFSPLEY